MGCSIGKPAAQAESSKPVAAPPVAAAPQPSQPRAAHETLEKLPLKPAEEVVDSAKRCKPPASGTTPAAAPSSTTRPVPRRETSSLMSGLKQMLTGEHTPAAAEPQPHTPGKRGAGEARSTTPVPFVNGSGTRASGILEELSGVPSAPSRSHSTPAPEDGLVFNLSQSLPESTYSAHFTEGDILGKGITGEVRVVKRKSRLLQAQSSMSSMDQSFTDALVAAANASTTPGAAAPSTTPTVGLGGFGSTVGKHYSPPHTPPATALGRTVSSSSVTAISTDDPMPPASTIPSRNFPLPHHTCSQSDEDRTYAMKTLNKGELDPRQLQELKTEIALLRRLDHPNVVRLVETFEDETSIRLVMEHCTGGDLSTRTFKSERDVTATIFQITDAVAHCHYNGVVHRDLKLENIMFVSKAPDSPIKIIDFGLSSTMNGPLLTEDKAASKRLMETACGTAYYMAPEMLDRQYDEKVDVWAIGVIAFMILTGRAPFEGHSEKVVFRKIRRGIVDYRSEAWQRVSPEALSFVKSLLVVDPAKRPTAMEALEHVWLKRHEKTLESKLDPILGESVVRSFVNFGKACRMRRAALLIIAHNADHQALKDLSEFFIACDSQHSGSLSFKDFMEILHKFSKDKKLIDEERAREIFVSLDLSRGESATDGNASDGDGAPDEFRIRYSEFLAAVLELRLEVDSAALNDAFDRFDTHHQGYISVDDLRELLGVAFSKQDVEDMIVEAKISANEQGGRYVTRSEFLAMMVEGKSQTRSKILGPIEEGNETDANTVIADHDDPTAANTPLASLTPGGLTPVLEAPSGANPEDAPPTLPVVSAAPQVVA